MKLPLSSASTLCTIALSAGVAVTLAGCSENAERTYTVDEFVADQAMLADQIAKCRTNPGALANNVNCRNAEASDGKSRLERMRKALEG